MTIHSPWVRGALACIVFCTVLPVRAQLLTHPYVPPPLGERTIAYLLTDGQVRRAHELLRQLRTSSRLNAASDALSFDAAELQRHSGNGAAADREMLTFLRQRPNAPGIPYAWFERGLAALEEQDDAIAIQHMDQAASTALQALRDRSDSSYAVLAHAARYWQASAMARQGQYKEALDAFTDCARILPSGTYADRSWYAVGQLHERNQQYDSAIAAFAVVRQQYPRGSVALASRIREAQNHLVLRQAERALDVLTGTDDLMRLHAAGDTTLLPPQDHADEAAEEISLLRSEAMTLRGKYRAALDSSLAFLSAYPASTYRWHVHLNAGYNALNLDEHQTALDHYSIVVDSVTDDTNPLRQLALLYRAVALKRSGRTAEALQAFQGLSVQTGYPYQAQALLEVGQAYYEDGDMERARKALERAERDSRDAVTTVRAQLLLGATLIEQTQWSKAAAVFERAEQIASTGTDAFMPDRNVYLAEARLKRGICLVQASQTRPAISALTDFLGHHPDDARRDEATFWLAESMYREDLLKNAQELYEEVINRYTWSPRREEALYGLAWTFFRRRNFDRSVQVFGEMLTAFPKSRYAVEAYTRRGDGFYITKQYRAAAEQYGEAARRGPSTEEGQYAAFQSGQASYRGGDLEHAKASMRAFVLKYPNSRLADDALYLIGWVEFQQHDYSSAIGEFRKLLDTYPTGDQAVRALYTIGDAQYNNGELDNALETYRQVIRRYPSHPLAVEAARSMQYALQGMGRVDEALAIADTLINANPQSVAAEEFTFKKAEIFYSGKNYSNAASELEAFMKKYPSAERQDEALYMLGMTYLNMKDVGQARNAFNDLEKKYAASSFVPKSKLELAEYFEQTANATSADSIYAIVLERFASDTPNASRAGFERASLARMRGDSVRALDLYRMTADRYQGTEFGDQARYQVAMVYRKQKQNDSARYHFMVLAARTTNALLAADALYHTGETFVREKRYAEAIPIFTRVREEFAGNEDWYTLSMLLLGESHEQLQQTAEALDAYQVVAGLRPDDDYGKTAQARIKRLQKGGRR